MSEKDVNIHIKTPGAEQSKQQLDSVAGAAKKVGDTTASSMGQGVAGSERLLSSLGSLVGPLGFVGLATAALAAGKKIFAFFDELKRRTNEAVEQVGNLRKAYEGLFEALGAFDEASRKAAVVQAAEAIGKAGATEAVGVPVIEAYTRQFKDVMPEGEFKKGQEYALSYAARHGGKETGELIQLMRGWGMTGAEQQYAFERQVSQASQESGLTDTEIITALGRAGPTAKAMGWTPQQTLSNISLLAQGETGRNKSALPATTIEAIVSPSEEAAKKYGFTPEQIENPQSLFEAVQRKRSALSREDFNKMLRNIYGGGAASGVYKLMTADKSRLNNALDRAAGPEGRAADVKEQEKFLLTLEAIENKTAAENTVTQTDVTPDEVYESKVRDLGEKYKKVLERRQPVRQFMNDFLIWGNEAENEDAAFWKWADSLSKAEIEQVAQEDKRQIPTAEKLRRRWENASPREKFELLTYKRGQQPVGNSVSNSQPVGNSVSNSIVNVHHDNSVHYHRALTPASARINDKDLR